MTEGDEIVDVVVVVALHDDVDDGVEHCALFHRRLGARRLDVALDLLGHGGQPVHVQDLLADLLLVLPDVAVRVDLLGPEVVHDLHGPLAEDVALEDVGERRLGSTENTSTFLPWLASQYAAAAEKVVLPTPPPPPNMMYRRSGCCRNTSLNPIIAP